MYSKEKFFDSIPPFWPTGSDDRPWTTSCLVRNCADRDRGSVDESLRYADADVYEHLPDPGGQSKRYTFAPQIVTVTDELTELNFTADPLRRR